MQMYLVLVMGSREVVSGPRKIKAPSGEKAILQLHPYPPKVGTHVIAFPLLNNGHTSVLIKRDAEYGSVVVFPEEGKGW